jgi:hypothetical protein
MSKILRILLLIIATLFAGCNKDVVEINTKSAITSNSQSLKISPVHTDIPVVSISASSTYPMWDASNAIDSNTATSWSSARHLSSNGVEFVQFYFSGAVDINYVKLTPRYGSNNAGLCFPLNFTIYYYTGSSWVAAKAFTNFANPQKSDNYDLPVTIPLPVTVHASGIKIEVTGMRADGPNYYFQLAEVAAGFDDGFNHFKWTGNDNAVRQNRINNAGSDSFNPDRIFNWTQDDRDPIIRGTTNAINPNIYAPNIVYNGGNWHIYYGGWDNTSAKNDRIFTTVTYDDFLTFGTHTLVIGNGDRRHVNNETVLKKPDGSWLMYYTSLAQNSVANKPSFATSADGIAWAPNTGSGNAFLNMANYPNWATADVNGSNVAYLENGIYHLYFNDFATRPKAVHHAVSTDGINFNYAGDALAENLVAQDVKAFTYNNATYYLMGMHHNRQELRYSLSNSLTSFPASSFLLGNYNAADLYIVSMGFVTNANRLYGIIYGAGPTGDLSHNSLHARWLTKKIIFISDRTNARWGDIERAHGPNQVVLYMSTVMETGRFYVYDTDGTTLLYTSPQVTMRSGDVWTYKQ